METKVEIRSKIKPPLIPTASQNGQKRGYKKTNHNKKGQN